jgi:hypothetical protein
MMSVEDCLKAAWQALLRGDLAERDRLCKLAENLMRMKDRHDAGGPVIEGEAIRVKTAP